MSISFGRGKIAIKRRSLYKKAARKLTRGNLSKLIVTTMDKALGIDLPQSMRGRPKKQPRKSSPEIEATPVEHPAQPPETSSQA